MKSIKIGILTFHASHNYGSMLQAYALQTFLTEMGVTASIINYRGAAQSFLYIKPYKYWDKTLLLGRLKNPSLLLKNMSKWKKFEKFMQDFMMLTDRHSTIGETRNIIEDEKFDIVITGGDQIWGVSNPDFYLGYFLPFYLPSCLKVSYAVSIGDARWTNPKSIDLFFNSMLSDFCQISVREKSTADILSQFIDKPIRVMPDPVFLLTSQKFDAITKSKKICPQKYLFYYDPKNETDRSGHIYNYAQKRGLKAVNSNSCEKYIRNFVNYNESGPSEFINLVKHAEMICGYSMHLVIFALLYHKPFIVISDNPDARLTDLLKDFKLIDRVVPYDKLNESLKFKEIDWEMVDTKIQDLRKLSISFFQSIFEKIEQRYE